MTYASEAASSGFISDAMNVISDMAAGKDSSYRKERLDKLKNLKTEDLAAYDTLFGKLASEGIRVTVGSSDMIKKNADTYKQIINQFAK